MSDSQLLAQRIAPQDRPLARRQFLRQGQLAGSAVGGILAGVLVGLLPVQSRLVENTPELGNASVLDVLRWLIPIFVGMGIGFLGWLALFEHRRPSLRGGGWTSERDWAVTGGLFAAFLLTRLFLLADPTSVSGLYPTQDPGVFVLVDAPIDIARAMVRFLASASIAGIVLRVLFQAIEPLRARRRAGSVQP
jgi:hypothetical protein